MASSFGWTVVSTLGIGLKIKSTVRVLTYTVMVVFTQALGTITKCTATVNSLGRTEAPTKATMTKTSGRVKVYTSGLMAGATKAALKTANSMGKDDSISRGTSQRPDFGTTGNSYCRRSDRSVKLISDLNSLKFDKYCGVSEEGKNLIVEGFEPSPFRTGA